MTYSKKGTFLKRTTVGTASLLLAGAFLFGGGAVHANQANNGSLARGDDYPYYYKGKQRKIPLLRVRLSVKAYWDVFSTRAPLLSTWKPSIVVSTANSPDAFT